VPIVVTGFEPLDIFRAVLMVVQQLESGRAEVENQYVRAVRREGTSRRRSLSTKFQGRAGAKWRGVGEIPQSGLGLNDAYAAFDAEKKFDLADHHVDEPAECLSGLVLQGQIKPHECPAFGTRCHAGASARRDHGIERGRMRRLLLLSPTFFANG